MREGVWRVMPPPTPSLHFAFPVSRIAYQPESNLPLPRKESSCASGLKLQMPYLLDMMRGGGGV